MTLVEVMEQTSEREALMETKNRRKELRIEFAKAIITGLIGSTTVPQSIPDEAIIAHCFDLAEIALSELEEREEVGEI